jgi:predicted nucleic acid-binding protein
MSTTTSDSPSVAEPLVINTGPIVALCLAGATEPVGLLPFEFLAPAEVASEIAAGQERGYRVAMPGWVSIVPLSQPVGALGQSALDAIQLVAIDEARGRRAAKAAGLTVTGSLGLLGLAKTRGLIPAVGPFVAAMQTGGVYLDDALVRRFLAAVGEPRS